MKFLLMMSVPRGGAYEIDSWAPADREIHFDFLRRFSKQLADAGELVGIQALAAPEHAKLVRAGKDGRPITDGVFPESKEFLAGYWIDRRRQPRARLCDRRRGVRRSRAREACRSTCRSRSGRCMSASPDDSR